MRGRGRPKTPLPTLPDRLLSPQQRAILALEREGLTVQAIAQRLGTSVGAVKAQIHKIRTKAARLTGDAHGIRLMVPVSQTRAAQGGADALRGQLRDKGRVHVLYQQAVGEAAPAYTLAEDSPEVWRARRGVLRVLAAAGRPDRLVAHVDPSDPGPKVKELMRQGKVLRRTPDGTVYLAIPKQQGPGGGRRM